MILQTRTERFWGKVTKTESCWLWTAALDGKGYGRFWDGEHIVASHRYSWILVNGKIPDGMNICHHCDVPVCIRPTHLFMGTQKQNIHDMIAKGRDRGRWPIGAAQSGGQATVLLNLLRTHCVNGHEMSNTNTYQPSRGGGTQRQCRECRKEAHARYRSG